jgi:hypothetical protein
VRSLSILFSSLVTWWPWWLVVGWAAFWACLELFVWRDVFVDPYDVCRQVAYYQNKNGYAPLRSQIGCTEQEVDLLVANGVIELFALHDRGPKIKVALTDKGRRMASGPPRRAGRRS